MGTGMREDFKDFIATVSPEETPFLSLIGTDTADNTFFEWSTDALDTASTTNAALEGDDFATTTFTAPSRVGNRCQISTKGIVVTGTVEAVRKAGRASELARMILKRGKELRRDMEAIAMANQGSTTGATDVARKTAGVPAWYATTANASRGSGGSAGGFSSGTVAAATDSSTANMRALTESILKTALAGCWDSGANIKVLMCSSTQKQNISTFTGNATRMDQSEDRKLVTSVDVYESDFGQIKIVPNRLQRARDVHLLDPDMWKLAYLRPFQLLDIAKAGDSEKRTLLVEWGTMCMNEKGNGVIADVS
jgi:hypothetical protein